METQTGDGGVTLTCAWKEWLFSLLRIQFEKLALKQCVGWGAHAGEGPAFLVGVASRMAGGEGDVGSRSGTGSGCFVWEPQRHRGGPSSLVSQGSRLEGRPCQGCRDELQGGPAREAETTERAP